MPENSYYPLAYVLFALYSGHAAATECETANTQQDMNICYDHVRQLADEELTLAYQKAMKKASDQATKTALRDAERAWISYRDKECEFESSGVRGGSVHPMIFTTCLTEMIRARTKELNRMLNCEEGDMSCPLSTAVAANAEIYNYSCNVDGKPYPLRVDASTNTLEWRGAKYSINQIECGRVGWHAEGNGTSFDFCTATKGYADIEKDGNVQVQCDLKRR